MDGRRDELRAIVRGYVEDVLEGRRVVGRLERLAVERHAHDLAAVESGERDDIRFHEPAAFHALEFAEAFIRFTSGNKPRGERLRWEPEIGWMAFLLWAIFGWQSRKSSGVWGRRYDEAYVAVARGNAKTFFAAIVALLMYVGMGEAAPEVCFAATQRAQAAYGWKQAAGFIKASPALSEVLNVHRATWDITRNDDFEASFTALSRNADEFDGRRPFLVVLDEVHAHKTREMYDVLRTGLGKRSDESPGLNLLITTRGSDASSFCAEHEKTLIQVIEGAAEDDGTFVFIACADEDDDPGDEMTWRKASPNLGISVSLDTLRGEWQRAKNDPAALGEFKRKRLNLWTTGKTAWLPVEVWDRNAALPTPEPGSVCYAGIDASAVLDMTALVAVFPSPDGEYFDVVPRFWMPATCVDERAKTDKVPIRQWVEEGLVEVTLGEVIDQDQIKAAVHELASRYDLRSVPTDPYQTWKLLTEMESEGLPVYQHRQGWRSFSGPINDVEGLLRGREIDGEMVGRIRHGGNPVLRWMLTNTEVIVGNGGNKSFAKSHPHRRIDGIVAMTMALGRALQDQHSIPNLTVVGG